MGTVLSPSLPGEMTPAEQITARKSYRKDIPAEILQQLAALETKDNWHNIYYVGLDWAVIALAIAVTVLSHMHPIVYILAVIVIGSRQRGLMNLLHEASHKKLFKNHLANAVIGRVFRAYPMGASFTAYQSNHFIHHGFLWDITRDPKTQHYQELGLVHPAGGRWSFITRHVLPPILLLHSFHNIRSTLSLKDERQEESPIRYGFIALLIIGIVLSHQWMGFLLFWLVPYCTSFQVIRYWNEMAEHAGLFDYNAWMATRSWSSVFWMEWLLAPNHNDLYHLAHHLFPLIPHYHLAKANRILMAVPPYAASHRCDGFFLPRRPDAPSVLQDIRRPQDIGKYHARSQGVSGRSNQAKREPDLHYTNV